MRSMPSVMKHDFSRVPKAQIPRSRFDRSHGHKTTFNAGFLVPIFVDEALPGDTFSLQLHGFGRLATPLHPIMDNMYLDTQFFGIPIRLLWKNWERFNGAQDKPSDSTDFLLPVMNSPAGGYAEQSIHDYFGLPTKVAGLKHHALFHRAYALTFNEWYRDQNMQDGFVDVPDGDGPDDPGYYNIRRRGKRHDYFTSALPWPQKGPSVPLPLTGDANVTGIGVRDATSWVPGGEVRESGANTRTYTEMARSWEANSLVIERGGPGQVYPRIVADLGSVTAATINELRQAFQVQKVFERDARGGTRYTEIVRSHFGVVSPDARLQRPEYLGGGSSPIIVNPVAQTSETSGNSPQGNLAAIGTLAVNNHGFTKTFTEHCLILGLVSIRADLNYQQGLNRMWSRETRFDFYLPALAHIGEQAVLQKEIYAQGTADDDIVFGYQERWAEYRYKPSLVTGRFRSNATQPLHSWHLAQEFSAPPTLNSAFVEENPPVDRVIAVNSEPHMIFDSYVKLICARPMPMYSVPGLIDHF